MYFLLNSFVVLSNLNFYEINQTPIIVANKETADALEELRKRFEDETNEDVS